MDYVKLFRQVSGFVKKEIVLSISAVLTLITFFFVPPSLKYIEHIDFSVLAILFCLMAVVAGYKEANVFEALSYAMLKRISNLKMLGICLVGICFLCSMFVTNDVALITFVPFTIGILSFCGQNYLIFIIVMETVAANLGSMMTPIGNPQNLFLFRFYDMEIGNFFGSILPIGIISLFMIASLMLLQKTGNPISLSINKNKKLNALAVAKHSFLLLLCLMTVLHLLDYRITFAAVLAVMLFWDRELFKRVDYLLLLTFVCFFLFVGNVGSIPAVNSFVSSVLKGREMVVSALLSQVISNVPAAVMLAPFTDNAEALLRGVNIGGLGTLIASFASLISYKFYSASEGSKTGRYLLIFSIYNFSFLLILILISCII